jgi:P-type Ca2+ transporter type 2C
MTYHDLVGLTQDEATRRHAAEGPNLLPGSEPKTLLRIVLGVLLEPMFLMLLMGGSVYLLIGDTVEAVFLLTFVLIVIFMTLMQERKTQRALEALRELSAPRALVIRDGNELRVASRDVVRGDLLVLHEGDRIAADAVLMHGQVSTDESLLTGEAAPQDKLPGAIDMAFGQPGDSSTSCLYASTVITRGLGVASVSAIAKNTAVGRIGTALLATGLVASNLQTASRTIVRRLAIVGLLAAISLVLLSWLWDGQPLLQSLLQGIALAMALLPEEIPVVFTVFLALGAWRLSKQHVLTRRVGAVEALGAITVLAVDKTGTLTLNRMQLSELSKISMKFLEGPGQIFPDEFHELVEFALLATPVDPFDPMEKAIHRFGQKYLKGTNHMHADWSAEFTYPLSPEVLAMTRVFPLQTPAQHLLATKGAPEAVASLCHLTAEQERLIALQVQDMASRGLRVLAVAKGQWNGQQWPVSQHDFDFIFLGLLGLVDPPRPEVPAAIAACQSAGIRIIMMTGDHAATALAIAKKIGLSGEDGILTGPEIVNMEDEVLRQRLNQANVCARLQPEQKLRLVHMLQKNGETVGMTGDGVNDAPALKAADIGIAMGERGTDVAREAAAIVLLNDSFVNIIAAIRQGRRIYDNICAASRFIFAVHIPVIALALMPVLFRWPVLLLPVQIVLLQLLIDPACSVVFETEPESEKIMDRPPRAAQETPFALRNIAHAVMQGLGLAVMLLVSVWLMVSWEWPDGAIRFTIFTALILGLFLLVIANRQIHRSWFSELRLTNPWLMPMLLSIMLMLSLFLSVPWVRRVMSFTVPPFSAIGVSVSIVIASMIWMELLRIGLKLYPKAGNFHKHI